MEGFQDVARRFINTTKGHLFLTGKAGTGKTTFLKNLPNITHKTFIVVAPTGIAALNAGGVTIHSQFLLPFGTFIPDASLSSTFSDSQPHYTQHTLARKHPLNSTRKQVLRSIDLLVIDEVSMMRADLLDAIDYRLKAVRGNFSESFGGIQVLFIGDLYQLPPVVKREDQALLNRYYKSPWFYEAKALERDPLVFIELDKIYRQNDAGFINLLNNLRNNIINQSDIDELNKHYRTVEEIEALQEVVTLTTHNYKADELNSKALKALSTTSYFFQANIEGEFPESMYPVLHRLELKVGAQIMFIRNDAEGQYFNGKLAIVKEIAGSDIWVEMATTHTRFKLKRERWENKKYTLQNDSHEIDEEVVGSFEQFPIKLAWAITVHKSQGLTFEKAIIDVGEAFADGQVYVAMSRLRSLDGLVLRTRIHAQAISTDKNVAGFTKTHHRPDDLENVMKARQQEFMLHFIERTFDFTAVGKEFRYVIKDNLEGSNKDSVKSVLSQIAEALEAEKVNTDKFKNQLAGLLSTDQVMLLERIKKGATYYHTMLSEKLHMLLQHQEEMRQHKRVKTYLTQLTELDVVVTKKLKEIDKAALIMQGILKGEDNFNDDTFAGQRDSERALMLKEIRKKLPVLTPKKVKKAKKKKIEAKDDQSTYDITINLLRGGMTVKEIAAQRGLVVSTIEGHLAKAIETGVIMISSFVNEETVKEISDVLEALPDGSSLSIVYQHFNGKYSYGLLRAVVMHRSLVNDNTTE